MCHTKHYNLFILQFLWISWLDLGGNGTIDVGFGAVLGSNLILQAQVGELYDISAMWMKTPADPGNWWFKDTSGIHFSCVQFEVSG